MEQPIIALLTDFGEDGFFVASLKGVILGINPAARIVDICHTVPPYDITAGALLLRSCFRYFPEGTLFLAVVDPGVGSERRILLAEADGYAFLGPDNGLFAPVFRSCREVRARSVANPDYFLGNPSATFEARDKMAPAAAWLSKGIPPERFGDAAAGWEDLDIPRPEIAGSAITGCVVAVDRFGNLVTNIAADDVAEMRAAPGELRLEIAGREVASHVRSYASVGPGEPLFLMGSTGYVEVSVARGSAAQVFHAGAGEPVRLVKRP